MTKQRREFLRLLDKAIELADHQAAILTKVNRKGGTA